MQSATSSEMLQTTPPEVATYFQELGKADKSSGASLSIVARSF